MPLWFVQNHKRAHSEIKSNVQILFTLYICHYCTRVTALNTHVWPVVTCAWHNWTWSVKQSRNRPGMTQRVPGGLGSQISMTFGTWRWWGCQPHAPAAFTPRKCSWYSFSLGAGSTPGPWCSRKEYVTEKSSDTTGNRSRNHQTSSAAP